MKEILAFSFLLIPLIWELINDRHNDLNKKLDVFIRIGLVIVCAVPPWFYGHSYWASVVLSGAIFFLLFDYLIHIIMLRRRDWFSYLGTTSKIDQIEFWKNMSPWNRFFTRLMVFMIALTLYIKL